MFVCQGLPKEDTTKGLRLGLGIGLGLGVGLLVMWLVFYCAKQRRKVIKERLRRREEWELEMRRLSGGATLVGTVRTRGAEEGYW
jgi:hypothetical protein